MAFVQSTTVLGVRIDNIDMDEARERARQMLDSSAAHMIITPNPEILLYAHHDPEYRNILNTAALSLPDGFGIRVCSRIRHTVRGVDFAEHLLREANVRRLSVLCIIRSDGRSTKEQIQRIIATKAPNAQIQVWSVPIQSSYESTSMPSVAEIQPDMVLVGLGFPYQEQWIHQFLPQLLTTKIAIGIGGAFDFWTGEARRAPKRIQQAGFEWLWRLIHEPWRLRRIARAVIRFPLTVAYSHFRRKVV